VLLEQLLALVLEKVHENGEKLEWVARAAFRGMSQVA
jgi:hypothetical protein